MEIKQFKYAADNLAYLIYDNDNTDNNNRGIAVDPGATEEIMAFIKQRGIELSYVVNTHTHADHTSGNSSILKSTNAEYLDMASLIDEGSIELSGELIRVYHTPGHTRDSVVFHFEGILLTGDTLLTGKAGRCFTGDLKRFLESMKLIMSLPDETIIYGGHDYVEEYMQTAKMVEPHNKAIEAFLAKYKPDKVFSTLAEEYKINPTLRFNEKSVIEVLRKKGLPVETEYERWCSIKSIV